MLGLIALGGLSSGCSGTASEERLELATQVTSSPREPFDNEFGWTVTIDAAWMSIEALSLLEGAPLGFQSPARDPRRFLRELFIGTAYAHPGHYQEGGVLAEMLTPTSVDLTKTTPLGTSHGITGHPGSGKVVFGSPATGPFADRLEEALLHVVGRAERADDSSVRHFLARADRSELSSTDALAEVTGCPFEGGPLRPGGTIELRVDLALWFNQVDFEGVSPGSEQNPTPLDENERAHNGLLRGVAKAAGYSFHFVEGP